MRKANPVIVRKSAVALAVKPEYPRAIIAVHEAAGLEADQLLFILDAPIDPPQTARQHERGLNRF